MTSGPADVSFYADFQGLAALKNGSKAQDPAALKEVAQQFESLFTQMLLKSMREANRGFGGDTLFGSDQADFYQGMFDSQIAMHLAQGKGLGLADLLVEQLLRGQGASSAAESGEKADALRVSASSSTTTQGSALPASASKEDFVRTFLPHARAAAREIGVDPHALLAQAALETGWGKSVPCSPDGKCSFNLFGIKTGSQWSGASVNVPTLEFEDGVAVRKVERFRAYDSVADSFRDYASLIRHSPRYLEALGTGSDVTAFASALQQGGYATDPEYASKIVAVTHQVRALSSRNSHG